MGGEKYYEKLPLKQGSTIIYTGGIIVLYANTFSELLSWEELHDAITPSFLNYGG